MFIFHILAEKNFIWLSYLLIFISFVTAETEKITKGNTTETTKSSNNNKKAKTETVTAHTEIPIINNSSTLKTDHNDSKIIRFKQAARRSGSNESFVDDKLEEPDEAQNAVEIDEPNGNSQQDNNGFPEGPEGEYLVDIEQLPDDSRNETDQGQQEEFPSRKLGDAPEPGFIELNGNTEQLIDYLANAIFKATNENQSPIMPAIAEASNAVSQREGTENLSSSLLINKLQDILDRFENQISFRQAEKSGASPIDEYVEPLDRYRDWIYQNPYNAIPALNTVPIPAAVAVQTALDVPAFYSTPFVSPIFNTEPLTSRSGYVEPLTHKMKHLNRCKSLSCAIRLLVDSNINPSPSGSTICHKRS